MQNTMLRGQLQTKKNSFHDGVMTASLPIAVAKYVTVTPMVTFVFPICDDTNYEMKAISKKVSWDGSSPSDGYSSYSMVV